MRKSALGVTALALALAACELVLPIQESSDSSLDDVVTLDASFTDVTAEDASGDAVATYVVPDGANLVSNPGFEIGPAALCGAVWKKISNQDTLTLVDGGLDGGGHACLICGTGGAQQTVMLPAFAPNTSYVGSMWFEPSATPIGAHLLVAFHDNNDADTPVYISPSQKTDAGWTFLFNGASVPYEALTATVSLSISGANDAGGCIIVDDVSLTAN